MTMQESTDGPAMPILQLTKDADGIPRFADALVLPLATPGERAGGSRSPARLRPSHGGPNMKRGVARG
jgi:hypothetical protein